MKTIPYTWSEYVDTPCRQVVNLADVGVHGVPVLGMNRADSMSAGSIFHRHVCLEITVCERGSVKFDMDGRAWTLLPGMTPHEFLVTCRIRKAIDILKSSDTPITRLALELGFSSSQHFAARFRRETGQTPRELRRANVQKIVK